MLLIHSFESLMFLVIIGIIKASGNEQFKNAADGHSLSLVPNKYHVTPGSEVILTCRMKSNSKPTVEWLRNEEIFPNKFSSPNASVHALKMNVEDNDNPEFPAYRSELRDYPETANVYVYTCIFKNNFGENRIPIAIEVGNKPNITSLMLKPSNHQPKGRNISATCKARSKTMVEMKWFYVNEFDRTKDKIGIEILDETKEDSFDIERFVEDDEEGTVYVSTLFFLPVSIDATYICQAKNDFGVTNKKIEVITVDLKIGDPCKQELECSSSLRNADCIRGICSCPDDYSIYVKSLKACLTPMAFRGKCEHSLQCKDMDKHTYCTIEGRETCQCMDGFLYSVGKRQCIKAKAEHTYRNVLVAIGCTLVLIVGATLSLYFGRKYIDRRRLRNKIRKANLRLGSETLNDDHIRSTDDENRKKKVHFSRSDSKDGLTKGTA